MSESHPRPARSSQPPAVPYGAPEGAPPGYGPLGPGVPAPVRKKSLFARWWFWLIVAILLIGIVGAVSGAGKDAPAGQASPADGPQGREEPAGDVETAAPALPRVGETATVDGFDVVVTSVQTGVPSVGDEYLKEEAQGAFVLVDVRVTNNGSSAATVLSSAFVLLDAAGREFAQSTTASIYLQGAGFAFEQINPGNTATGTLVFDLPVDTAPQTLDVTPGMFGGDSVQISLQ